MAATESPPVIADTGPIIHLDELSCIDLLGDFSTLLVPREVWEEALHHRPQLGSSSLARSVLADVPRPLRPSFAPSWICSHWEPVRRQH